MHDRLVSEEPSPVESPEPDAKAVRAAADPAPVIPDRAWEDMGRGWGEREDSDDDRFLREKPPHWQ